MRQSGDVTNAPIGPFPHAIGLGANRFGQTMLIAIFLGIFDQTCGPVGSCSPVAQTQDTIST